MKYTAALVLALALLVAPLFVEAQAVGKVYRIGSLSVISSEVWDEFLQELGGHGVRGRSEVSLTADTRRDGLGICPFESGDSSDSLPISSP